ncbi:MAG: DnaD domain protein [Oscillospiraceae bacterium]|nr:DnaD domain protein [Oscillospiraceae bacterium]
MAYTWGADYTGGQFGLPAALVDELLHMPGAVHLKVLLWLVRHGMRGFDADACAKAIRQPAEDCRDALLFWMQAGVLVEAGRGASGEKAVKAGPGAGDARVAGAPAALSAGGRGKTPALPARLTTDTQDGASGATGAPPAGHALSETVMSAGSLSLERDTAPLPLSADPIRPSRATPGEVAAALRKDKEFGRFLSFTENCFNKLLPSSERETLLEIYRRPGLDREALYMAVQYAADNNRRHASYVERLADDWARQGICTLKQVNAHLDTQHKAGLAWETVQRVTGTPLSGTAAQRNIAYRWVYEWHIGEELMALACGASVAETGRLHMGYANQIIENWHFNNITDVAAAKEALDPKAKKRKKRGETSFDLEKYEESADKAPVYRGKADKPT